MEEQWFRRTCQPIGPILFSIGPILAIPRVRTARGYGGPREWVLTATLADAARGPGTRRREIESLERLCVAAAKLPGKPKRY